jgi:hypothetical protein
VLESRVFEEGAQFHAITPGHGSHRVIAVAVMTSPWSTKSSVWSFSTPLQHVK